MAKKKAKKKAVKKSAVKEVAVSSNPYGDAKVKLILAKRKFKQDQVVYFDELRKSRLQ
jgi:hypothetical protein